ncbi:MAG: succinate--CoA ligase subunit alpha, partial [Syntrophorhabdaceae bacterium]|nr:succinate--CoA ligase subunit alpha [Syntrophorhabdaceae bacterium]
VDLLAMFEKDEGTDAMVIIGEIGGRAEEEAAEYFRDNMKKPVVAFIAGLTAPPGRRMGHAGAIISGGAGGAGGKIKALESAGITVVKNPAEIGETVAAALKKR